MVICGLVGVSLLGVGIGMAASTPMLFGAAFVSCFGTILIANKTIDESIRTSGQSLDHILRYLLPYAPLVGALLVLAILNVVPRIVLTYVN